MTNTKTFIVAFLISIILGAVCFTALVSVRMNDIARMPQEEIYEMSSFGRLSLLFSIPVGVASIVAGVVFGITGSFVYSSNEEAGLFHGWCALHFLAIGFIFLLGFFDFFKGISLLLGIIGSIIGIIVGVKKLSTG